MNSEQSTIDGTGEAVMGSYRCPERRIVSGLGSLFIRENKEFLYNILSVEHSNNVQ